MFYFLRQPEGFYRRVFRLALPVVLQNFITTSLGFMDTFMVGLLGSEEMSAVTVANVPVFIMQLVVFGLQSGSSVLISQYWGKGDRESINRVLGIGLYAAGALAALFGLLTYCFPASVLYLVTDNPQLVEIAAPYLRIVGFSYVFHSLAAIYIGMQRSIENTRFGMLVFGVSTVVNTLGNFVLIFGKLGFPALGVAGAAAATFSARALEFVLSAAYALRCRALPLRPRVILRPGREMLRGFVKYSTPVLLNETLWGTGASLFTVIMGHMADSTDILSAYTIAGGIDKMVTAANFGVAAAAAVVVGKEIGMGNRAETLRIGKALAALALGVGVGVGALEQLLYWLALKPYVVPLFRLSATAAPLCTTLVCCYSAAAPVNAFAVTMIVGVLRGGGDVRASLLIDIVPLWCVTLPLLALLGLVWDAPALLLCMALCGESALKLPFGLRRLWSGRWIRDVTAARRT